MTILTRDDFRRELTSRLKHAAVDGKRFLDVTSRDLHRELGGYPGPDHRMPVCCRVMREEMRDGDEVVGEPPSGQGASLTIRYVLDHREFRQATVSQAAPSSD